MHRHPLKKEKGIHAEIQVMFVRDENTLRSNEKHSKQQTTSAETFALFPLYNTPGSSCESTQRPSFSQGGTLNEPTTRSPQKGKQRG